MWRRLRKRCPRKSWRRSGSQTQVSTSRELYLDSRTERIGWDYLKHWTRGLYTVYEDTWNANVHRRLTSEVRPGTRMWIVGALGQSAWHWRWFVVCNITVSYWNEEVIKRLERRLESHCGYMWEWNYGAKSERDRWSSSMTQVSFTVLRESWGAILNHWLRDFIIHDHQKLLFLSAVGFKESVNLSDKELALNEGLGSEMTTSAKSQ